MADNWARHRIVVEMNEEEYRRAVRFFLRTPLTRPEWSASVLGPFFKATLRYLEDDELAPSVARPEAPPIKPQDKVTNADGTLSFGYIDYIAHDCAVVRNPGFANGDEVQLKTRFNNVEGLYVLRDGKPVMAPWPEEP